MNIKKDIDVIKQHAKDNKVEIITTEKDYVKIAEFDGNLIKPIEVDLEVENKIELNNFLKSKLYEKY